MREVDVLKTIKGKYVVEMIDVKRTASSVYLFIEYCDGGDLFGQIKKGRTFERRRGFENDQANNYSIFGSFKS